jgi:dTDP-glucose 4,6-dehydratase
MTLHGDGLNVRDWIHVETTAPGCSMCSSGRTGETYNFGGECERTNRQIADLVT